MLNVQSLINKGAINISIFKKIIAFALSFGIALSLTACKKNDGKNYIFRYDISANPVTLDPQQANEPNSNIIIKNVYLGLLTVNSDGSIDNGVAEKYSVSPDGLTYTFTLRDDIFWTNSEGFEEKCTAKDFVFGFERLFSPVTESLRAKDYYCIKDSESYHNGGKDSVGVKALSDFELEITLEEPNPRFPVLLTEPSAMPCCEKFFTSSQGKYGLSAECTPSNGAFYVRVWNFDPYAITENVNYLILNRNKLNAEALGVCPSGLNFFIEDDEDLIPDFNAGETDCISVSNDNKALVTAKDSVSEEFCCSTGGLIFNRNFELFQNEDFVKALSLLADRNAISASVTEFESANGIVPNGVTTTDSGYRETVGACTIPEYNAVKAGELFRAARSSLNSKLFTGSRIIVCKDAAKSAVSYIMQEWQREFGFYCVVEELESAEFSKRLQSGDFEMAVTELTGSYNSPDAYLEQFREGNSANYSSYSDSEFEAIMSRANQASDVSESVKLFKQAEQMLIDKAAFIPLYYKNEYFFIAEDAYDIVFNPFTKTVDFTTAKMM